MVIREVKATLLSACCLSSEPAMGNETETLHYIPGSIVRGILATTYLSHGGQPDTLFQEIFWQDKICFPYLYPERMRPLPLSAYTCKTDPGFSHDQNLVENEDTHGVWDLLFENLHGFQGDARRRCTKLDCGKAPLKAHTGFYKGREPVLKSASIDKRIQMRTAISPELGSALEASLHSREELPAGTIFYGLLTATDDALWEKLKQRLPEKIIGFTGKQRSGKMELVIQSTGGVQPRPNFFNLPGDNQLLYSTLTLTSDTVLIDPLLRPVVTLTPNIIKDPDQVGFPANVPISIKKAFCATRRVSGWNNVGQIFKADDIALKAGSTFLLEVPANTRGVVQGWMEKVTITGIGLRRSEGFGQVRFDEPLHMAATRNLEKLGGPL
jgi:hypothetical protein